MDKNSEVLCCKVCLLSEAMKTCNKGCKFSHALAIIAKELAEKTIQKV